jgi:parallel beta-helix repeat protein
MVPLIILLAAGTAAAVHLQDAYNEAGPGEGYDRLVELDPAEVYTGYLVVLGNTSCCLRGNGALIVLDEGAQIWAGASTRLDVEGCVITGGSYGISYDYAITSTVSNCTLVGNGVGLRAWIADVTVTNCIIAGNDEYGIACRDGYEPAMLYNDVWGNGVLDYAAFCPT